MKKFKEMLEQHREKGRFHPVKPYNVQNTAAASPRPSSDSASVKLKEDLRKWFSKTDPAGDWKRINSKGEAIGPCAREPGEPKPKCMSRAKRESLTKKERAAAVRAKRKHDPNPERKGEPINVSNFGKGKISENMEKLNKNNLFEKWSQKYKSSIDCNNPKGFSQKAHCAGKEKNINEEKKDQYDEGEYDQEGDMAKSDLRSIMANAKRVHDMLEDSDNLPEWVQSKITKAEDYMSTVANYMTAEMNEGAIPAKEKVVTVRHKISGKELVVTAQKAKELKKQDYHPVKEEVEQIDELSNKTLYSYLRQTGAIKSSTEVNPRNTSNVPHDLQYQAQDSAKSRINARKGYDSVAPKGYAKEEVEQIDEKNVPTSPEKWAQAKAQAKAKFDVYPSAYANGWAAKKYKAMGGGWRSVSEEVEQIEESIEVKKEYNDKTEAEHGVYHKGKKIGYVVHHKPSGTHTAYHSPQDDDDYGQIDDFRSHHDAVSQIRHSAGVGVHEEVDAAIGLAKPKTSLTPAAKTLAPQTRVAEGSKPPFDKPYTTIKGVITDKSGAKHTPMSRARDIARMAMKKQAEKMKQPVKESLDESRRMEIVREAMKVAKKKKETTVPDDKYQSDPVLSSQITKT